MKLSHSKLSTIISCPATYYLNYEKGIKPKAPVIALMLGSAVHWGIENNTEDLTEYFKTVKNHDEYTTDQMLAEAMVHGYFKHKDDIFNSILSYNDKKLQLVDEYHEIKLEAKLKSNLEDHEDHDFEGILDLLFLTDEGFIVIDYKTSSLTPNWDEYLDQIYRYIYLLNKNFPGVPVIKIGIINIRKTAIRQKKNENDIQFFNRMKLEYEINDDNYISYHEFSSDQLDENLMKDYIANLTKMADAAQITVDSKNWYINFANAKNYGRSKYWDIFYSTPDAEQLYEISDRVWNEETGVFDETRDCIQLDMRVLKDPNIIDKYSDFKILRDKYKGILNTPEEMMNHLKKKYLYDEGLIRKYFKTYEKETGGQNE